MSWIEDFTIAIVEENPIKIGKLINEMPHFEDLKEARTAQALIQEALTYMKNEQHSVHDSMQKLKKTKSFITSINTLSSHRHEYRG